ncbi:MAG: pentapeptide repeat-containing protein [Oscillospiraceae bacterium]|jgi:hypothetical protein|nr:pentapeptide repeat-containing protein [Oscillospiraceae bacterium]
MKKLKKIIHSEIGLKTNIALIMVLALFACAVILALIYWVVKIRNGNVITVMDFYEILKIMVTLLGVLTGAGAATVAFRSQKIKEELAENDLRLAEKDLLIAQKDLRLAEIEEMTKASERFTKAVELLNSDNIGIRIGGIYALEKLAMESEEDSARIAEVLCAYLRSARPRNDEAEPIAWTNDLQALVTVLSRLNEKYNKNYRRFWIDISRTDLRGANLSDTNLSRANLIETNLCDAQLIGTNLRGANLYYAIYDYRIFAYSTLDKYTTLSDGSRYVPPDETKNNNT